MQSIRTIAIVGGGFSGVALAIELLRRSADAATRVVVIEPRTDLGSGVAYASRDYPYPLNVAAAQMSLRSDQPRDFLEYLHGEQIHSGAGDYLPRQVYGEYLRARLADALARKGPRVEFEHRRARALQARRAVPGPWQLWLDDGGTLAADDVVLALGTAPPACPTPLHALPPGVVVEPWHISAEGSAKLDSVLLLGSGLTMIDAALRLAAVRPRVRRIHVLSRHGLLPQVQANTNAKAALTRPDVFSRLAPNSSRARSVMHTLRALAREITDAGGDWRELIAQLRPHLPDLWRGLPTAERARFLRHARPYWDVHRHRAPAGPLAAVRNLERQGVLELHAGRLLEARSCDGLVEVQWLPRGERRPRAWLVDRVVNCTGPDHRVSANADPLVRSLLNNGSIRPDVLDLGLDVAADGRVVGASGAPVNGLYYLGPWLRARDWEATAVPELRVHAEALARVLSPGATISDSAPRSLP